jgi:hypothetical protein
MPNSKKLTLSNIKRDRTRGNKMGVEHRVSNYVNQAHSGNDPEKEIFLAREIGEFNGANAKIHCAQAIAEVAIRHSATLNGSVSLLFSEAIDNSFNAAKQDSIGFISLKARRLRRQIMLGVSLAEGAIPGIDFLSKAHDENIDAISAIFSVWDKVKSSNIEAAKDVKGFMSEEAVTLLLERYGVNKLGQGWVPMHSLLSEVHGRIQNGKDKSGWDVSIYTDCAYDYRVPTHKLQVKTRHSDTDKMYADRLDIDLVCVSDLIVKWDKSRNEAAPQYILNELMNENQGTRSVTHRLDERTEVLLDIFS